MLSLAALNALSPALAESHFRSCCGSSRWVAAMASGRPFSTLAELHRAADVAWETTGPDDWAEAFEAHPRIGAPGNDAQANAEQGRAAESAAATRAALADLNTVYERRFGWIYIVCASGRTGDELIEDLRSRLGNTPERELAMAAAEQHRITRLRLGKLIGAEGNMTRITTHVLDTALGKPGTGIAVRLERFDGGTSVPVAAARTDAEGRVRDWTPATVPGGRYRLVFETGAWFHASGRETLYPEIVIHVIVSESEPHYHIPVLLSPFGYSTYRGS